MVVVVVGGVVWLTRVGRRLGKDGSRDGRRQPACSAARRKGTEFAHAGTPHTVRETSEIQ